ncbi:MAG: RHS repeat-associated core domain-containing protein [Bacteroidota bacterium]
MITKQIKYLLAGLLLLIGLAGELQAQASLVETELTWVVNNSTQHIAAEALPADADGYLDFIWDGYLVYYGFYKNQIPNFTTGLDFGVYLSGSSVYVRHNNGWHYQGTIGSAGDHFRVAKEGDNYVMYHNGTALYTGSITAGLTVYPYIRDNNGVNRDRLEYFKKPPVYTPEWVANNSSYYLTSEFLGRGQDGFVEYEYSGDNYQMIGFSKSKNVAFDQFVARLFYRTSNQRMYMYLNGTYKGSISAPLTNGDKLIIERKGSTMIYSAGNAQQRYAVDGNLDIHPWCYEYTSGARNQVKTSFEARGGVCQDYFDRLPSYVNVNADTYYPPSPTNESWNIVHTKTYDGEGEGSCHVLKETKSYTNESGHTVQIQNKDYLTGKVWATETIYDYLGRPALTSLAAPTGQNVLQYKINFIRDATGLPYGLDDFDRTFNSSGVQTSDKTNLPNIVGSQANTLGAWYSSANTEEPWQATTHYPYARREYSELTGLVRRAADPGNAQRMGNGKETMSFAMRAGNELRYVIGRKKPMCVLAGTSYDEGGNISATCTDPGTIYNSRFTKTITVDADGKAIISFQDDSGNEIARALSGKVNGANKKIQNTTLGIPAGEYHDIHVTDADNTINVWAGGGSVTPYDVYDLTTDQKIISNSTAHPMTLSPGFYRFVSKTGYLTLNYDLNYYNFSLSIYDKRNQLIASVAPKDVVYDETDPQHHAFTFYRYNSHGQLIWEESPDVGRTTYFYRKDGKARFSQNAKQAAVNDFSYIKYDGVGRKIETGEYIQVPGSLSNLSSYVDNDSYPSYSLYKHEEVYTSYEVSDPALPSNRAQKFVQGQVAKISNDDGTMWYSYDQEGRLSWLGQSVSGLSGIKYTDYKYDLLGKVTEVIYQEGQTEEFRHHYTYDDNNQMTSVSTRTDGSDTTIPKLQAQYKYTSSGDMARTNLAEGLERKHYVYTLDGALKAINPKDMTSGNIHSHRHVFSMALDYYPEDYIAANGSKAGKVADLMDGSTFPYPGQANYTGLIAVQRWKTRASVGGNDYSGHFAYAHRYNHRNELIKATFGEITPNSGSFYDGNFNSMNDYKVQFAGDGYDENGNIQGYARYGQGGTVLDNVSYQYDYSNGKNRLTQIFDFSGASTVGDLPSQGANNYAYNQIGQLTEDVSEDHKIVYNTAGKVIEVRTRGTNLLKVAFKYGPDGQRVKKLSYNTSGTLIKTTWYLRSSGGVIQGIYEKEGSSSPALTEWAILGMGHLGTALNGGSGISYEYELKDHLGNVRAVLQGGSSNVQEVEYYADYYPYGWTLPGRNGGASRYAYQGEYAEKDEETGWIAFELRMYEARIGRWMATDPKEQYWSPYMAMGNDPINAVDPNGGWTDYKNKKTGEVVHVNDGINQTIEISNTFWYLAVGLSRSGVSDPIDNAFNQALMSMESSVLISSTSFSFSQSDLSDAWAYQRRNIAGGSTDDCLTTVCGATRRIFSGENLNFTIAANMTLEGNKPGNNMNKTMQYLLNIGKAGGTPLIYNKRGSNSTYPGNIGLDLYNRTTPNSISAWGVSLDYAYHSLMAYIDRTGTQTTYYLVDQFEFQSFTNAADFNTAVNSSFHSSKWTRHRTIFTQYQQ